MLAVELRRPDQRAFELVSKPRPGRPASGQALVRMRAAGLNFIDLAVASGAYHGATFPLVPVADGAAEIVEVGPEVELLEPGDRVVVHPKAEWVAGRPTRERVRPMRGVTMPGSLVELQIVDAATLAKAPADLDWPELAALPTTFTTGWNGLVAGGVMAGSTVVVLGTGAASLATLQLAKAQGANVIVTSSSNNRLAQAKQLGADHGINYRENQDWPAEVLKLTRGFGADLLFEAAGSATFASSLRAVRQGGTVFTIGFKTGSIAEIDLMKVITGGIKIVGGTTGSVEDLSDALRVVVSASIRPTIAAQFDVRNVANAYAAFAAGKGFGKTIIDLDW